MKVLPLFKALRFRRSTLAGEGRTSGAFLGSDDIPYVIPLEDRMVSRKRGFADSAGRRTACAISIGSLFDGFSGRKVMIMQNRPRGLKNVSFMSWRKALVLRRQIGWNNGLPFLLFIPPYVRDHDSLASGFHFPSNLECDMARYRHTMRHVWTYYCGEKSNTEGRVNPGRLHKYLCQCFS